MALSYAVDICNHEDVERIGDTILDRWRNAPDDPVETVALAIGTRADWRWDHYSEAYREATREEARVALSALGCVSARETKGLGCALPRNEDHA